MENVQGNLFAADTDTLAPPIEGRRRRETPAPGDGGPQPAPPPAEVPETRDRPSRQAIFAAVNGARWVLAIPAIFLAIYAGNMIEQARTSPQRPTDPPLLAWQLFALSGILLAAAVIRLQPLFPSGPSIFIRSLKGMKRKSAFLIPLGLSIVCALASVPLFFALNLSTDQNPVSGNWLVNTGSWLLFIASLLLFATAWIVWERTTPGPEEGSQAAPPKDRLPRWVEFSIMGALLALALFLRVPNLDNVPPGLWFDEAYHGNVGLRLLAPGAVHSTFVPDIVHFGSLYFYFLGIVVKLAGNIIWPLRILPALAGSLCVPMIYLLASRLYGWRAGLAAAGFLAVSSWNITFSRFGMVGMFTAGLDVATFLCVAQGLRTGRLGYYAGAGVLLGLASQTYYTFRMDAIVLVLLTVLLLVTQRMRAIRALRAGLVVFILGAILASIPIDLYAVQHWDEYNSRLDTVSVLSPQNSPTVEIRNENLQHNVNAHLLMFNWVGDGNGRHNLSGTPMLDWIMAALFFAGLAACVVRGWRWQYAFPVLWFAFTLLGGILTLPFEAPQSHRTLENSIVTALLAGIFLGEATQVLTDSRMIERITGLFSRLSRRGKVLVTDSTARALPWGMRGAAVVTGVALLVVVWLAGSMDYHKYFEVQARDMGVWKDMYAPQAHAAEVSLRYGGDYDVYMAPILKGLPPSEYLAPNVQTLDWPGMQALPLSTNRPGGVIVILDLPSAADVDMIARLYPHAKFELFTAPSSAEVLIYTITIPTSDIKAVQGVRVTSTQNGSAKPSVDKVIPAFTDDASAIGQSSGTVRISTSLRVDIFGDYTFDWRTNSGQPGDGQLMVDGNPATPGRTFSLGTGLHSVTVTGTVKSGEASAQLFWTGPQGGPVVVPAGNLFDSKAIEPHGLTGLYRNGQDTSGQVQTAHVDPTISFNFHETPLPRTYTAEWIGKLYIPQDGTYTLGTEQLSTSQLYFDGQLLITNGSANNLMESQVTVTAGLHDIRIVFLDAAGYSHMYLYWTPPGRPHSIIPSAFLWPVMGEYPATPESGSWPTLDESDGSQLPPDRITYYPPRDAQSQATQNQSQGQTSSPPQPAAPQEPLPAGKAIEPLAVLGEGSGDTTLLRPHAVGSDSQGNIYVFSETNSKIVKFGPDGKGITSWPVKDGQGKPLTEGSAIIVKDDKVMLLDALESTLIVYNTGGQEESRLNLCQCFFARGASLARDGGFWVANTGGGQVLKVSPDGKQVEVVGDRGTDPGKFAEPAGVWEAPDGTLYVADISNKRVQSFTPDHKPLAQWDMGESVARDGNRLVGDSKGNVLVTEYASKNIVLYDKQGKELGRWYYARNGTALIPAGIAALGDDKFAVLFPDANIGVVFSTK